MNRSFLLTASVCCVLFVTMPPSLHAATITVSTTGDAGAGSLRDALASAADGDTIDFSVAGIILLTNGELVVTNNLSIVGPGPTVLLIDGNATNRVFHIGPSNVVSIASLTITNGFADGSFPSDTGGGIYNDHTALTVSNCTLSGNGGSNGGAIYNNGEAGTTTVQIVTSTVSGNGAVRGGGIYNNSENGSATLIIANSILSDNGADTGGSIYSDGENSGNAILTIANSTVSSNSTSDDGGGIYNDGEGGSATLTITNCILSGNSTDGTGGGIFNDGDNGGHVTLIIANSILSSNSADGNAGGIFNDGSSDGSAIVHIANSTLSDNLAGSSAGAIYNDGEDDGNGILTITNSILSGNSADSRGGGIYNDGDGGSATLTIANSTLSSNSATDSGGGLYNNGEDGSAPITMASSILRDNLAGDSGGGIFNDGEFGDASLMITNSTVSGNSATNFGGGIYVDGTFDGTATVHIVSSTLSSNSASFGGGVYNNAEENGSTTLTVTNSTLSGNSATDSGGAIYIDGTFNGTATVQVAYSTLSSNSAIAGGGIFNLAGALEIGNTILNAGSGLNITNNGGTVLSHGHNLSSDAAGGNGTTAPGGYLNATGDIRNTNPKLGPLANNGGLTFTHALLTNSPAISAGSDINCPGTDQRGIARPQGSHCDIGAFEVADPNPPVAICRNVTASLVSGCTTNVSIDNGSFDADAGDTITLSQSPAGPYPRGTNTVTLTVTDSFGATNSCTGTVIVVDNIVPTITCPTNRTASATSSAGAVVAFPNPVISDNCGATVSCVPPSGSTFPIGDTIVRCTATDVAGNTNSCTFAVQVKDASEQLGDAEQVILGLGIDARIKKSVLKKFQKIERQIDADHTRTACKQLQKLLRKVELDLFKERLTTAQAIQITTPLIRVLTVLGCP